jgi:hypothetical protein
MTNRDAIKQRILKHSMPEPNTGCWIWHGDSVNGGYGRTSVDGRKWLVHRAAYHAWVGDIPKGLTIDHLCKQPSCCNPQHMEPVTMKENIMRGDSFSRINAEKVECKRGHPLSGDNLYRYKDGRRDCRTCMDIRYRAYYEANRLSIIEKQKVRYESKRDAATR